MAIISSTLITGEEALEMNWSKAWKRVKSCQAQIDQRPGAPGKALEAFRARLSRYEEALKEEYVAILIAHNVAATSDSVIERVDNHDGSVTLNIVTPD